jgi:hypothetical protein
MNCSCRMMGVDKSGKPRKVGTDRKRLSSRHTNRHNEPNGSAA